MSTFDDKIKNNFRNSTEPNKPGSVDIKYCILTNGLKEFDLIGIVNEITITENMISNYYITGTITLEDGVGLAEFFPIIGDESLFLEFITPGAEKSVKGVFKIVNSTPEEYDGNNTLVTYTLSFVSYEYFQNLKEKVFFGRPKLSVRKFVEYIYDRYIYQKVKNSVGRVNKDLNIPNSDLGVYNLSISNMSPFNAIHFLSSKAIGGNTETSAVFGSGYLFFENRDNYNFISVESLFSDTPKLDYKQNPSSGSEVSTKQNIAETYSNIQNYTIIKKFDVERAMTTGAYSSRMLTLDLVKHKVKAKDFHYILPTNLDFNYYLRLDPSAANISRLDTRIRPNDDYYGTTNVDGQEYGVPNPGNKGYREILELLFTDTIKTKRGDWLDVISNERANLSNRFKHLNREPFSHIVSDRILSPQSKYFFLNSTTESASGLIGKSYSSKYEEPNNVENIFQQRITQLMHLDQVIMEIEVFGHTDRTIGQILNIVIPSRLIDSRKKGNLLGLKNLTYSGNYLVSRVTHKLSFSNENPEHMMFLELRTDSTNLLINGERIAEDSVQTTDAPQIGSEDIANNVDKTTDPRNN